MLAWQNSARKDSLTPTARADADLTLPSKSAIKASQLEVVLEGEQGEIVLTMLGALELDSESINHVSWEVKRVLWVPKEEKRLKSRVMVCSHMDSRGYQEGGDSTGTPTLLYVGLYGSGWVDICHKVPALHKQEDGDASPGPLGDVVHGTEVG